MSSKPFGLAVKAIIRDEAGRVLMLRRSDTSKVWPGLWDLPGGKADDGEPLDHALVREAKEETGLDIELSGFAAACEYELPKVRVVFVAMFARVTGGEFVLEPSQAEAGWKERPEIDVNQTCEPIGRLLDIALASGA